jgi:NTP pyrophosphatase (non-canonical NTP hydrolase)
VKKSWTEMQEEVRVVNVRNGWFDKPVSFYASMALLHSEISEALEAWRRWGVKGVPLESKTGPVGAQDAAYNLPKPEGVPSEFADILIRLLDSCERFGVDGMDDCWSTPAVYTWNFGQERKIEFPDAMNLLHDRVSELSWLYSSTSQPTVRPGFLRILLTLVPLSDTFGVDLEVEYEKKMAYNRQRPYRHGDKRI